MKYLHNPNYGVVFYPENYRDVLRCLIIKLLCRKAKWTWNWTTLNPVTWTVEHPLEETDYPDTASAG